eukprot:scaffold26892_cov132-Cylindrotheca_fusiformis.AAC.5
MKLRLPLVEVPPTHSNGTRVEDGGGSTSTFDPLLQDPTVDGDLDILSKGEDASSKGDSNKTTVIAVPRFRINGILQQMKNTEGYGIFQGMKNTEGLGMASGKE